MVSGASQSLAGHDPDSISGEKADRPLTDKNRMGIEKKEKGEINRVRAEMRELPWQHWYIMGQWMILGT